MTALLPRCAACLDGILRTDPYTGESGCGNCGTRQNAYPAVLHGQESPEPEPPVVEGGQGREPEDVVDDGDGIVRLLIVAGLMVAIVAVGVWAAGGGR